MRNTILLLIVAVGSAFVGGESTVAWAQQVSARVPRPSTDEQKAAWERVHSVFKELSQVKKSKSLEDRQQLALRLLKQGVEITDSPADAYICFTEARRLFETANDIRNVNVCIKQLEQHFEVDAFELKADSITVVAKAFPHTPENYDHAIELARIAQNRGRHDKGVELLAAAHLVATKLKDRKLTQQVSEIKKAATENRKEYEAYQKAKEILETSPDDSPANLAVGKYWCFVRGDWKQGAIHLVRGNDVPLKAVAQLEMDVPQDVSEMQVLANTWWELSERGSMKQRYQAEAAYWYEIVSVYGTGLKKIAAEKRLKQIASRSPRLPLQAGLLQLCYFDTEFKKPGPIRIDRNIDNNLDANAASMGLPSDNFSLAWFGYLMVPETGTYTLRFDTDDGGRLWLDDQLVFDQWSGGQNRNSIQKQLTAGPHRLKAHYFEGGGNANVVLYWTQPGGELKVVPYEVFFHEPNVARAVGVKRPN